MGFGKQASTSGNYISNFLHLFDWNAKSRNKLLSSKPDLPEKSKQKKRFDGNLPMTRLQTRKEDEPAAKSSIKGSSDYSCASSLTNEDIYGTKSPGVVARLMGLDSLPKSNPLFDSQSLPDSNNLEFHQDPQFMHSCTLEEAPFRNDKEPKYQRVAPTEKFRSEILPPSAKLKFIPPKNGTRAKSSSSVPLEVKDLKKVQTAAQKPSNLSESFKRIDDETSAGVKHMRGHFRNKSWDGSLDSESVSFFPDLEKSSVGVKSKGKSVSLALQAKANVQKRESLNSNSSRKLIRQKEKNEFGPDKQFTSESEAQKSNNLKKSSTQNVLRQNNQKQNQKALSGDCSLSWRQNPSKHVGTSSKVSSQKSGSEVKQGKRQVLSCSSERVTRKKRTLNGNCHREKDRDAQNLRKDKSEKVITSSDIVDRKSGCDQDSGRIETDVISFAFTAPAITRLRPATGRSNEADEDRKISEDSPRNGKFSFLGYKGKGGDALTNFLEKELKILAHKVEMSQQKSGTVSSMTSNKIEERKIKNGDCQPGSSLYDLRDPRGFIEGQKLQGLVEEMGMSGRNISEERMLLDYRLPSPVSVLELSSLAESSNSSDTAESNHTEGGKQCSTIQFRDAYAFLPFEGDSELSDSASSTSAGTLPKRQPTTLSTPHFGKSRCWQLEHVNELMCDIELMFHDYALGRASEIINPRLFDQLESQKGDIDICGVVPIINRWLLFDCVSECLELRCRQYVAGGRKLWSEGILVIKRKKRLAEDIYREISCWSAMGDFMVDELVDDDMSRQYGRWVDYEIEAFELGKKIESCILDSLVDDAVADILAI